MNRIVCCGVVVAGAAFALGCQDLPAAAPPLADGQGSVTALASDGDHVYWTTGDGHVRRVAAAGGAVEEVAQGIVQPSRIVLDTDSVYWATAVGQIGRAPKAGGTAEVLVQNEDGLGALQVDDASVYWLRGPAQGAAAGQVRKAAKTPSTSVETLAQQPIDPGALALSGATLYYPGTGSAAGMQELPTGGGTPAAAMAGVFHILSTRGASVCGAGPDPSALAQDPNATSQAITCAGLDGSNPRAVASGLGVVGALALDDAGMIYFATLDGSVGVASVDGSSAAGPMIFASGPPGGASVAVDATSVYWANESGDAIFAVPRF